MFFPTGCEALQTLPHSIGALTNLQDLDMTGCASLSWLPASISALASLRQLSLARCVALADIPPGVSALTGLLSLDVGEFIASTHAWPRQLCGTLGAERRGLPGGRSLLGRNCLELQGQHPMILSHTGECGEGAQFPQHQQHHKTARHLTAAMQHDIVFPILQKTASGCRRYRRAWASLQH